MDKIKELSSLLGIHKALLSGYSVKAFLHHPFHLRVVEINGNGIVHGYGESALSVEEALERCNEDFNAGGKKYEEVYGKQYEHAYTGNYFFISRLDKWILTPGKFQCWQEGTLVACCLTRFNDSINGEKMGKGRTIIHALSSALDAEEQNIGLLFPVQSQIDDLQNVLETYQIGIPKDVPGHLWENQKQGIQERLREYEKLRDELEDKKKNFFIFKKRDNSEKL